MDVYSLYTVNTGVPIKIENLYVDRAIRWGDGVNDCMKYIKHLTMGPNVDRFYMPSNLAFGNMVELESIKCLSLNPPVILHSSGMSGTYTFSNAQFLNLAVKVPYEALEKYKQADVWKNFWNIEGFDAGAGADDAVIEGKEKVEIGRYDLNGRRVSEDYNGIFIIKYSDGSVKKIMSNKN